MTFLISGTYIRQEIVHSREEMLCNSSNSNNIAYFISLDVPGIGRLEISCY
jgi:hypothetical protein